ncbi:MAG: hypothetical protein AVDCRST_MAG89-1749, partial [uncultured Gemmatimonadetes bacterium]
GRPVHGRAARLGLARLSRRRPFPGRRGHRLRVRGAGRLGGRALPRLGGDGCGGGHGRGRPDGHVGRLGGGVAVVRAAPQAGRRGHGPRVAERAGGGIVPLVGLVRGRRGTLAVGRCARRDACVGRAGIRGAAPGGTPPARPRRRPLDAASLRRRRSRPVLRGARHHGRLRAGAGWRRGLGRPFRRAGHARRGRSPAQRELLAGVAVAVAAGPV